MNIIACAYHWTGCKAIQLLRDGGHNVFVYTHRSPYHVPSVLRYCEQSGIPYSLENISEVELPFTPDVICSIYYRKLISKRIIDACGGRIFNLHPSLLPKYRGCSSVTWSLINGDPKTGYTYHYIDEGCDTGRIILQQEVTIEQWDTQETLFTRVMFEAMGQFEPALRQVCEGNVGVEQRGDPSYYKRGCPYEGLIDPNWDPEFQERFVRAMIYPPYPAARLNGKEIRSAEDLLAETQATNP